MTKKIDGELTAKFYLHPEELFTIQGDTLDLKGILLCCAALCCLNFRCFTPTIASEISGTSTNGS
jgi:hypothetical protein